MDIETRLCPRCRKKMNIMVSPSFRPQLVWFWQCDCRYEEEGGIEWGTATSDCLEKMQGKNG